MSWVLELLLYLGVGIAFWCVGWYLAKQVMRDTWQAWKPWQVVVSVLVLYLIGLFSSVWGFTAEYWIDGPIAYIFWGAAVGVLSFFSLRREAREKATAASLEETQWRVLQVWAIETKQPCPACTHLLSAHVASPMVNGEGIWQCAVCPCNNIGYRFEEQPVDVRPRRRDRTRKRE